MEVSKLLALLPDTLLDELAIDTKVNHYSKKLQGQLVFKLLLYCILSYKDNSLRMMESAYESIGFKLLTARLPEGSIHYSSLSERLNSMDSAYFEKLYKACVNIYSEQTKEEPDEQPVITRFDSTIVSLSARLLKTGYHLQGGDADHVKQLKFTVGLSDIPSSAHLFSEQKYTSENAALKEALLSSLQAEQPDSSSIKIFDQGITNRKTYDGLIAKNVRFISRINTQCKREEQQPNVLLQPLQTATLTIISDSWAYLFSSSGKSKHPVRLIRAVTKRDGEELLFVTNTDDLCAEAVTELYKKRWDIEVFFRFLKQELNFSHLLNRSENGIKIVLYATMIAAILLLVYKKTNKLSGYKIMKYKFLQELETALLKDFVALCGGNAQLVDALLKITPR